ncbi:hypothetical protein FACS189494_00690 [Spirochaetia bacterium]|nr:hypothetical protein FACS189494_00690 [Spirochaetia bacterium]
MNRIQIEEHNLHLIKGILKETLLQNSCKVFIFGSRAGNTALKYSDVDLALDYNKKPLPLAIHASLSSAFEESLLPYTVDIVDINSASKDFIASIKDDIVRIDYDEE